MRTCILIVGGVVLFCGCSGQSGMPASSPVVTSAKIKFSGIDRDTSEAIAAATDCIYMHIVTFVGGVAHPRLRVLEIKRGSGEALAKKESTMELAKVSMFEEVIRNAGRDIDVTSPNVKGTVVYTSRKTDGGQVAVFFKLSGPSKHDPSHIAYISEREVINLKSYNLPINFERSGAEGDDVNFTELFAIQDEVIRNHELDIVLDVSEL